MRAARADTPTHAGPARMVMKASRKPSCASLPGSMEPGAVSLRHAMKAMTTANCTRNHTMTPAAPHAMVPSRPHGGGARGTAAGAVGKRSWLIGSRCAGRNLESSRLAWRRLRRPLARQRDQLGGVAHRPLADAVAAAPLGKINVDMVLVISVRGRPEHRGEARAGARLQPFAHLPGDRDVGRLVMLAVGERQRADVERVALAVFADQRTRDAVAA